MKNVLVTGATGFIGYEVSRQLADMGIKPRALVRRPNRANLLSKLAVDIVEGDLNDMTSLDKAVSGMDTVIHLGARAVFEEYSLVRDSIVKGTEALARAAASAGVRNFVFASSLLVYSDHAEPIDGKTPATPHTGYGKAKVEAEGLLKSIAEQAGMSLAVLRLPHVYGARDLLFHEVHKGTVIFPGRGTNLYAHLHVADSAQLLIEAAKQSWTGVSPVADDLGATWRDFFAEVAKRYPHFKILRVPQPLAMLAMHLLTPFRRLKGYPSVHTPDAVRGWNTNQHVKPGLLWDELGIKPRYPTIAEGIPAVMDEWVSFKWIHSLDDHTNGGVYAVED